MNPPSTVLGGGVHGKVCWLIAYSYMLHIHTPFVTFIMYNTYTTMTVIKIHNPIYISYTANTGIHIVSLYVYIAY